LATSPVNTSAAAILAINAISGAAFADEARKSIAAGDQINCYGINRCEGKSECKTADNACKGLNECKGHGFRAKSGKACLVAGGKILLQAYLHE